MKTRRGLFGLIAGAAVAAVVGFGAARAQIISPSRTTLWQPGVTYNGGIPNRTTIYKTLSPIGGGADDTSQIQAALNSCPANQVVKLTAGVFNINGTGIRFTSPNCTLRGAGPGQGLSVGINGVATSVKVGTFMADSTATQLIKADRATDVSDGLLGIGNNERSFGASINLTADAVQGQTSVTVASSTGLVVGQIVLIDMCTDNNSANGCTYSGTDVVYGPSFGPPGDQSRGWFHRMDRSLSQVMEITAISGNTITFATPFHYTYTQASEAQLTPYSVPVMRGIGVEDLMVYGGQGGDGHGNIAMALCAYCWIKHVEAFWSVGTNVGLYSTYRSELRDSFIHETPDANPGGAGYQIGLNEGAADNLIENNISWFGNKEIVMRGTGGGNVVAYNYMDDSFDAANPIESEAGLNGAHYTTPHMELFEGNYSQNFTGDSYWGNSIYLLMLRNQFSGLRAAHAPLNTYTVNLGNCGASYPYIDIGNRFAVDVQAYGYFHTFIGNVLGFGGQTLLSSPNPSCYNPNQGPFNFEDLTDLNPSNLVNMWYIGSYQATVNTTGNWSQVPTTYQTIQRDGNFDWVTGTQTWLGVGGTQSNPLGTPQAIPNSFYLSGKPAFFGSNAWPWVNPSNGSVTALPAKARFQAGTYNSILTGGSGTAPTVPANLAAAAVSPTSIGLTWTASTGGTVVGYQLSRNGVVVATPAGTSYTDSGLTSSTIYTYTVAAVDSNNNVSAQSSSVSVTTLAGSAVNGVNLRGLMTVLQRQHAAARNITMGTTSILTGGTNSGDGNLLVGVKVALAQPATLRSLSFYTLNAVGNLRLGVYDATGAGGNPGALKAQTGSFVPVTGWNTQNVVTPVSLPAGTYWLAYLPSNGGLSYPSGTTEPYRCQSFAFAPMPMTFPAIGGCSGTLGWSFYATLSVP